jgi:hypothetical protein
MFTSSAWGACGWQAPHEQDIRNALGELAGNYWDVLYDPNTCGLHETLEEFVALLHRNAVLEVALGGDLTLRAGNGWFSLTPAGWDSTVFTIR